MNAKTKIDYEAARSGKRKVTTRCGYPVRLVSDDGAEPCVLVGYYTDEHSTEWGPYTWCADGLSMRSYDHGNPYNLIQEPEVIEFKRWVNVYKDVSAVLHLSESDARAAACAGAIARAVPITIRIVGDKVKIFGGTEERKDDE